MDDNFTKKDLTDKDFYQQACSYFYYHAGLRTTMINFFIVLFGASIALYGNFFDKNLIGCIMIACFMLIISVLFFCIDIRNRFDVKQSQSVICQIEKDYGANKVKDVSAYGVFSNEENLFKFYGVKARRNMKKDKKAKYLALRAAYRNGDENTDEKIKAFLEGNDTVSVKSVKESLKRKPIITLSFSIKMIYILCIIASVIAIVMPIVFL